MEAIHGTIPFNALGRQVNLLHGELLQEFESVLRSGRYIMGPYHDRFESDLADYLGTSFALGCGNGTDALTIALRSVGVKRGDYVMTAANAGGYTSAAISLIGAEPLFADVDETSHLITLQTILNSVNARHVLPRALVVTHLYGAAAPIQEIVTWAKNNGVMVVEDCAQALGAKYSGKRVGTYGDVGTTSFYPTKNLGALGDGGAIFTDNEEIAINVRSLRQYGWREKYHVDKMFGTNSRLDEIQAAILSLKLPLLDSWNDRRRMIHARYKAAAPSHVRFVNTEHEGFVGHLAVIEVSNRHQVRDYFMKLGISTEIHYPIPDHKQGIWRGGADYPLQATEKLANLILSIPLFPELTEAEIKSIEQALDGVPHP